MKKLLLTLAVLFCAAFIALHAQPSHADGAPLPLPSVSGNQAMPSSEPPLFFNSLNEDAFDGNGKMQDFQCLVDQEAVGANKQSVQFCGHNFGQGSSGFIRNKTTKPVEIASFDSYAGYSHDKSKVLLVLPPGDSALFVYEHDEWQLVYQQSANEARSPVRTEQFFPHASSSVQ